MSCSAGKAARRIERVCIYPAFTHPAPAAPLPRGPLTVGPRDSRRAVEGPGGTSLFWGGLPGGAEPGNLLPAWGAGSRRLQRVPRYCPRATRLQRGPALAHARRDPPRPGCLPHHTSAVRSSQNPLERRDRPFPPLPGLGRLGTSEDKRDTEREQRAESLPNVGRQL